MRFGQFKLLSVLILAPAFPLAGQAVLTGTVRQDSARRALPGAQVLLEGTSLQTTSDTAGRFLLSGIPSGRRSALFRAVGYRPVRVLFIAATGDTIHNDPVLTRSAQELEPIIVNAEAKVPRGLGIEGFEERRRMGFGKFIDSTELRRGENLHPSDVIRRAEAGIKLQSTNDGNGTHVWAQSSRKGDSNIVGPCWMQVIVDGVTVFRPGRPGTPPDLYNDFDVASLQAIEIYRSSAETPMEYQGSGADCGTIVLWTKRGWEMRPPVQGGPPTSVRVRFGFYGGGSLARLGGSAAEVLGSRRNRVGIAGGLFATLALTGPLAFAPEVGFAMKGVKGANLSGSSTVKLNVLELPFLLRLSAGAKPGKSVPYLFAGPAVGFRIGCSTDIQSGTTTTVSCDDIQITKTTDVSAVIGAGIDSGPVFLSVRYDLGLSNLAHVSADGTIKTRTLSVLTGFALNVGRR